MPKGKTLYLRQGIGETTIDNVDGQLSVDVAAAHTRVSHVRGSLSLDNGSGGATLDGIRGGRLTMDIGSGSLRGRSIEVSELVADVGSGGVRLSGVKTPKLHLETGSGGSDVELLSEPDDVSIEAGSGGVTLRMPATTNASVDIEAGSGGIDTDFEVKMSRIERRALRGTIGSGKARIRIESGSGNVRLMKS